MWSPTHVQVLVKKAKGLNVKGKNGTNDALVTIALGKEKYQTSVKEKAVNPVEWCEQCELAIPEQGNRAEVVLVVLHRNYLGVDEFLGQVSLPLQDYDVYEKPRTRWYPLMCKPGQNKEGYRGELELKLGFTVKATENNAGGSVADLRRGTKGSLTSLNKVAGNLGGSLLSLGGKERKNIKKLAKSVGKKVEKVGEKARMTVEAVKAGREKENEGRRLSRLDEGAGWGSLTNRDPGVNSDDEDEMEPVRDDMFQFDRLSHRSSIRSELSLGKLGMVSPALTPDLAVLRRGDNTSVAPVVISERQQQEDNDSLASFTRRDLEENESLTSLTRREQEDKTSLTSYSRRESQMEDNTSMASFTSHQTIPDDSSLPSYSQAMSRKKKIIPVVQSEPESSPSPEHPSSPISSPKPRDSSAGSTLGSLSSRFRQSQAIEQSDLGNKLKNSFRFKDKGDKTEKVQGPGQRTTSNTSLGPPSGTRVVLGRETSPTPSSQNQRIPPEILAKFQGKTREDLIELVVGLQANAETQGKKLRDLEDYLDGLLIRVMETAPILLQKEAMTTKPTRQ